MLGVTLSVRRMYESKALEIELLWARECRVYSGLLKHHCTFDANGVQTACVEHKPRDGRRSPFRRGFSVSTTGRPRHQPTRKQCGRNSHVTR